MAGAARQLTEVLQGGLNATTPCPSDGPRHVLWLGCRAEHACTPGHQPWGSSCGQGLYPGDAQEHPHPSHCLTCGTKVRASRLCSRCVGTLESTPGYTPCRAAHSLCGPFSSQENKHPDRLPLCLLGSAAACSPPGGHSVPCFGGAAPPCWGAQRALHGAAMSLIGGRRALSAGSAAGAGRCAAGGGGGGGAGRDGGRAGAAAA